MNIENDVQFHNGNQIEMNMENDVQLESVFWGLKFGGVIGCMGYRVLVYRFNTLHHHHIPKP